jgi:lipopolysaccharide export LptBFGC system permease protein LptF
MTGAAAPAAWRADAAGPRPGRLLAPFGCETRYVLALYLQRAVIFGIVGMGVVLLLDLATSLPQLLANGPGGGAPGEISRLAYYLLLRAGYDLPALLPITAIVGVIWAEYGLANSRERIMIANSGRPPLHSLMTALLFGLLLGALQFAALAYARPAAVAAQTAGGFRYYGPKFHQPILTDPKWIAANGTMLNARVDIGAGVALRDVLLYSTDAAGRLEAILGAASAVPGARPGTWIFEQGSVWYPSLGGARRSPAEAMQPVPFTRLAWPLELDPLWVRDIDVLPPLLAQSDLAALAAGGSRVPDAFSYRSAYDERFAAVFSCVGMALLGAGISLLTFGQAVGARQILRLGLCGGIAYLGLGILPMLADYGVLPSLLGAWGGPLALTLGAMGLLYLRERRVRARLAGAGGRGEPAGAPHPKPRAGRPAPR